MTYTAIDPASIVSGGTISRSTFGLVTASNFADHETRIGNNESDIRTSSNALTVVRDTAGRRYHAATTQLVSNSTAWVVHPFDTSNGTESGYTYSAGVFTMSFTGWITMVAHLVGTVGTDTGYYIESCFAKNSSGSPGTNEKFSLDKQGIGTSGQNVVSQLHAARIPVTAGDQLSVFIRANVAGAAKTYAPSNSSDASGTIAQTKPTNISIHRVA